MERCKPRRREARRLNLAVDRGVYEKFLPVMEREWGGSLSSWVEYAMECYSRDSCEGCPYQDTAGIRRAGIGRKHRPGEEAEGK
ncbi:MAG: hypothetical protein ACOC6A_02460 [Chloroflexota bacterium]